LIVFSKSYMFARSSGLAVFGISGKRKEGVRVSLAPKGVTGKG